MHSSYQNWETHVNTQGIQTKQINATQDYLQMRRQAQRLSKPYPATAKIPDIGLTLFDVGWHKSYDLARKQIIETIETGTRGKLGLVHKTCAKLGVDPNRD